MFASMVIIDLLMGKKQIQQMKRVPPRKAPLLVQRGIPRQHNNHARFRCLANEKSLLANPARRSGCKPCYIEDARARPSSEKASLGDVCVPQIPFIQSKRSSSRPYLQTFDQIEPLICDTLRSEIPRTVFSTSG